MEKIIRILEKSGVKERIQRSVNHAGGITVEVPQEVINGTVGQLICLEMNRNEELKDAVVDYAMTKAVDEIVAELGIKYQPDSKEAHEIPLSMQLLETILKSILD